MFLNLLITCNSSFIRLNLHGYISLIWVQTWYLYSLFMVKNAILCKVHEVIPCIYICTGTQFQPIGLISSLFIYYNYYTPERECRLKVHRKGISSKSSEPLHIVETNHKYCDSRRTIGYWNDKQIHSATAGWTWILQPILWEK